MVQTKISTCQSNPMFYLVIGIWYLFIALIILFSSFLLLQSTAIFLNCTPFYLLSNLICFTISSASFLSVSYFFKYNGLLNLFLVCIFLCIFPLLGFNITSPVPILLSVHLKESSNVNTFISLNFYLMLIILSLIVIFVHENKLWLSSPLTIMLFYL